MDLGISIAGALALLEQKIIGWWEQFVLLLPNIIIALIITIVGFIVANYVQNLLKRILPTFIKNQALISFLSLLAKLSVIFFAILTAIKIMSLDDLVFSLLAGVGIAGLALGFAFQDIAANFIAGIALVFRHDKPFKMGDIIETNGFTGIVLEINLRDTMIKTFDGHTIFIPNKNIFENPVTNYTLSKERRIALDVGISYSEDLDHVIEVVKDALAGNEIIKKNSPIEVYFQEFADSSINFRVHFWIHFDHQKKYFEATDFAIRAIKRAFDREGITIPFPIRTIEFNSKGNEVLPDTSHKK